MGDKVSVKTAFNDEFEKEQDHQAEEKWLRGHTHAHPEVHLFNADGNGRGKDQEIQELVHRQEGHPYNGDEQREGR